MIQAKVMIIENDRVKNLLIRHLIEDLSHMPLCYGDVESAQTALKEHVPDLFIIGTNTEKDNETVRDFISHLLKTEHLKSTPIVALSPHISEKYIETHFPDLNPDNIMNERSTLEKISQRNNTLL